MRIFVAGATGKLGHKLVSVLSEKHTVSGVGSAELDITDFASVRATIEREAPELVINAAAWTNVDGCANDPTKATLINGYGAQNLAIAAYQINAGIVQVSSNEVFDGTLSRPYQEYDPRNPVNPYGYSKFVGERSVAESNPAHYIVRTAWVFAHTGRNFIHAILDAAKAGKTLRVVVDEVANPTYNDDLAEAISHLIETGRYGTYHLTNSGSTSRYDFARYALDKAGFTDTPIERISRHEWPRPSTPPVYTGLANINAAQLGITLPAWQDAVDEFLAEEGFI